MQKTLAYDRQLERFAPLDRVVTFDDFDTGFNGWMDLTPNFVYEDYESFDSAVDLTSWAPCMLSSAPMRFAASHGSMEGTYSLSSPPVPPRHRTRSRRQTAAWGLLSNASRALVILRRSRSRRGSPTRPHRTGWASEKRTSEPSASTSTSRTVS